MDNKISIVILNYDRWDLCHQLLFDIYKNCTLPDEVLVVNNGCTQEESFTGLKWWIDTGNLPVRELRIKKNIGFLRGANAGFKDATGDIIVLLSNDVRIKGDIVLRIQHLLQSNPRSLVGGRLLDFDTGWNTFNGTTFIYLEGWLIAGRKDILEEIGYFDELYAPNDMEDIDLSTKAISIGCELFALPEDLTSHLSGQTLGYNPEREALTKINREKFREKWIK